MLTVGYGAVAQFGRALDWQSRGQGFKSPQLHSQTPWYRTYQLPEPPNSTKAAAYPARLRTVERLCEKLDCFYFRLGRSEVYRWVVARPPLAVLDQFTLATGHARAMASLVFLATPAWTGFIASNLLHDVRPILLSEFESMRKRVHSAGCFSENRVMKRWRCVRPARSAGPRQRPLEP